MKKETICIDFDGTIVEHKYPDIGGDIGAIPILLELQAKGHKLILYTMRSGERLQEAVKYCKDNGLEFYAVNNNPTQKHWTKSPKIYGSIYIDDAALGTPLIQTEDRPYVDWIKIKELLINLNVL